MIMSLAKSLANLPSEWLISHHNDPTDMGTSTTKLGMKSRSPQLFYPPKLNPTLVWLLQQTAPWFAQQFFQLDLVISAEPLVQLSTLREHPCLLLCNHSTFQDRIVLFLLSARLKEPFYYMTAHEQFGGVQGWLYQQIGAYSIRRGLPDRDSIVQTIDILTRPQSKLVMFPEGGCSFQNDTVMPFRPGAIQMALQVMARQAKRGQPVSDLYAVPMSLKYRYTGSMTPVIERTLAKLEKALGIVAVGDYYQRLRVTADLVIVRCEQDYGITPTDLTNWNQRIAVIKAKVIQQCEQKLGLTAAPGEADRERVYRVRYALENRQTTLLADGTDAWDVMSKAMIRVLNFDAIYDGYVAEKPTPERFLDTLIRLEREVFEVDEPPPKGYRQAFLRVGKPVNLKNYLTDYMANRPETVATLVQQLQHTVQQNLNLLSEATARDISW